MKLNTIKKGCYFDPVVIKFKNENGTPLNITGDTFILDFKLPSCGNSSNANAAFSFSTADGSVTIVNALNGEIMLMGRTMNYLQAKYFGNLKKTNYLGQTKPTLDFEIEIVC